MLIVDDHSGFRRLARELLQARGYVVAGEAGCVAGALEAAAGLAPDAVLLDIRLGDESGYEVARALRRFDPPPAVLLVSVAGDGSCVDQALAREAGASGFLLKGRLAVADLGRFWPPPPTPRP